MLVYSGKHVELLGRERERDYFGEREREKRETSERAAAISKVPTVSMLEAMTGTPLYVFLEFLKINSLCKFTCNGVHKGLTKKKQKASCFSLA